MHDARTCAHHAEQEEPSNSQRYRSKWIDGFVTGLSSEFLEEVDGSLSMEEFQKTIVEYLPTTRINISIRQVEQSV